jgi:hypothetical protein
MPALLPLSNHSWNDDGEFNWPGPSVSLVLTNVRVEMRDMGPPIKAFVLLILLSLGQSPATSRKHRHLSTLADTWLHAAFLNVLSLIFIYCSVLNTYSHLSFPYGQSSPCLHPCFSSLIQITLLSCCLCKSEDMCLLVRKRVFES